MKRLLAYLFLLCAPLSADAWTHGAANPDATIIANTVGPIYTPATVRALGSVYAAYLDDYTNYEQIYWTKCGAAYACGGTNQGEAGGMYYDGAYMRYVLYAQTGNATYKTRAKAMVDDYINNYLIPNNYTGSFIWQWSYPRGLAIDYQISGSSTSLSAIGKLADTAHTTWLTELGNPAGPDIDARVAARILQIFLYAWRYSAPSAVGANWATDVDSALTKVLVYQSANGAWDKFQSTTGQEKTFMSFLINDALIEYYRYRTADSRIPPAVKANLDYNWTVQWVSSAGAFKYTASYVAIDTKISPTPSLNLMGVSAIAWYYTYSSDATYLRMADTVFYAGVGLGIGSFFTDRSSMGQSTSTGGKTYNEQYTESMLYPTWRGATAPTATVPNALFSSANFFGVAPTSYGSTIETTLSSGVNNSTTSIPITSATGFPGSGNYYILVGDEIMQVTGGQGSSTWTATRAASNSTAASHSSGQTVIEVGQVWGSSLSFVSTPGGLTCSDGVSQATRAVFNGSGTFLHQGFADSWVLGMASTMRIDGKAAASGPASSPANYFETYNPSTSMAAGVSPTRSTLTSSWQTVTLAATPITLGQTNNLDAYYLDDDAFGGTISGNYDFCNPVLAVGNAAETVSDVTPATPTFTAVTGATINTVTTSNTITISGINTPVNIQVSAGTYSINGGAYTSSPGIVYNGDTVTLRLTSSGSSSTAVTTTVYLGGQSDPNVIAGGPILYAVTAVWSVTTA